MGNKIRQAIVVGEKDRVLFEFEEDTTEEKILKVRDKVNEFFKDEKQKVLCVRGIKIVKIN
jgi:hypothetical protein